MDRIKKLGPQTDGGKEAKIAVKKKKQTQLYQIKQIYMIYIIFIYPYLPVQ